MPSSSLSISFVCAIPEDFEDLLALRIDAMRESLERIGRFDPARARERFLSGFSAENTRHIENEHQRVGFVVTKKQVDSLLLDHLYIHPKYQNRGIGGAVIAKVIAEARALHLPVRVGALRESDSNRFYVANGFQLIDQAEFDNYYILPVQNAL